MMDSHDRDLLLAAMAVADGDDGVLESTRTRRPDLAQQLDRVERIKSIASAHRVLAAEPSSAVTTAIPSAQPLEIPPIRTWGGLRILERIGGGGFGDVYRAFDPTLQRDVALKLLRVDRAGDDPDGENFLAEARRLARVRHPNVLTVYGADRHNGRVGMWTELLLGRTLETLLAEHGPLNAQEASLIGRDLCRALASVHAAGLIHRDVKTENVMREEGGRIVLMDFGTGWEQPQHVEAGSDAGFFGTPLTMAPEQLRSRVAGPRTDVYGLGVLLYRLVSGRYPLEARTVPELLELHRRLESVPLQDRRPDLPAEFVQIVEKALQPDPGSRFASAGAMGRALSSFIGLPPDQDSPTQAFKRWWASLSPARQVGWIVSPIILMAVLLVLVPTFPNGLNAQLTATAFLHRIDGSGEDDVLVPGDRISVGDILYLSIEGSAPMSVYVLNEDELGHAYLLFPNPELDLRNPLPAKIVHRLPGTTKGGEINWQVTSPGGEEIYTVVASRGPLEVFEREIRKLPHASMERPIELPKGAVHRGTGGLAATIAPPDSVEGGPLLATIRKVLRGGSSDSRDHWIWQIQLSNPAQ